MVIKKSSCCSSAKTTQLSFIILVSFGLIIVVYEWDTLNSGQHTYGSQREVGLLRNDKNRSRNDAVWKFNHDNNRSSSDSSKMSGLNRNRGDTDLLSRLHLHINLKAASKTRKRLIRDGFSPHTSLQIYLHNAENTVVFPKRSIHHKRLDGSPWLPEVDTCAVLGSGGILKGSKCGDEIDAHELVFRSNMAPIAGFVQDVGRKTNITSLNSFGSRQLVQCFNKEGKCRDAKLLYMNTYLRDAIIWFSKIPAISATNYKKVVKHVGLQNHGKNFIYAYPRTIIRKAIIQFFDVQVPSSGLYLYSLAGTVCNKVSLYGFYPFNQTVSDRTLDFHYYGNNETFQNSHNMPKEYMKLLKLNRTGVLRLVTNDCM